MVGTRQALMVAVALSAVTGCGDPGEPSPKPHSTKTLRQGALSQADTVSSLRERVASLSASVTALKTWSSLTDSTLADVTGTDRTTMLKLQLANDTVSVLTAAAAALRVEIDTLANSDVLTALHVFDAGGNDLGLLLWHDHMVVCKATEYCDRYTIYNRELGVKFEVNEATPLSNMMYFTFFGCSGPGRFGYVVGTVVRFNTYDGTLYMPDLSAAPTSIKWLSKRLADGTCVQNPTPWTEESYVQTYKATAVDEPPFPVPLQLPLVVK